MSCPHSSSARAPGKRLSAWRVLRFSVPHSWWAPDLHGWSRAGRNAPTKSNAVVSGRAGAARARGEAPAPAAADGRCQAGRSYPQRRRQRHSVPAARVLCQLLCAPRAPMRMFTGHASMRSVSALVRVLPGFCETAAILVMQRTFFCQHPLSVPCINTRYSTRRVFTGVGRFLCDGARAGTPFRAFCSDSCAFWHGVHQSQRHLQEVCTSLR